LCSVDVRCSEYFRSHSSACVVVVCDAEMSLIGNVADVRSKILSSLVSQFNFGGQLKEGMMSCSVMKIDCYCSDRIVVDISEQCVCRSLPML